MSTFRIVIEGIPVEVASAEDAIALMRASKKHATSLDQADKAQIGLSLGNDQSQIRSKPAKNTAPGVDLSNSVATRDAWDSFISLLNQNQIQVLYIVKNNPNGITAEHIGEMLERQTNSITGSIGGGLRKNIPRAGFEIEQVIRVTVAHGENYYHPGPLLLSHEVPSIE